MFYISGTSALSYDYEMSGLNLVCEIPLIPSRSRECKTLPYIKLTFD